MIFKSRICSTPRARSLYALYFFVRRQHISRQQQLPLLRALAAAVWVKMRRIADAIITSLASLATRKRRIRLSCLYRFSLFPHAIPRFSFLISWPGPAIPAARL